jgi:hypothetical protein
MTTPSGALLPLVAKLKACPAHDNSFSDGLLRQAWNRFKQADLELTPAVLAGLIVQDEQFARLLNEAEQAQMTALAKVAWERYQKKTNPPNQLGKLIVEAVKEL